MNGYSYPQRPYPAQNNATMMDLSGDSLGTFEMGDGQSLDDIVNQNDKYEKVNRRRSMPAGVYNNGSAPMGPGSPDSRRFSSMNFGDPAGGMDNFQFNISPNVGMEGMMRSGTFPRTTSEMQNDRIPTDDLAINTQFSNTNSPFLDMDMSSPYPTGMSMGLEMNDSMNMMATDMNMFPNAQFTAPMMDSPATQDFAGPLPPAPQDPSMSIQPPDQYRSGSSTSVTPDVRPNIPTRASSQEQGSIRSISRAQSDNQSTNSAAKQMANTSLKNQEPIALPTGQNLPPESFSQIKFPWVTPNGGFPSTMHSNPHMKTQFKNVYSSTGFDMLGVLVRFLHFVLTISD